MFKKKSYTPLREIISPKNKVLPNSSEDITSSRSKTVKLTKVNQNISSASSKDMKLSKNKNNKKGFFPILGASVTESSEWSGTQSSSSLLLDTTESMSSMDTSSFHESESESSSSLDSSSYDILVENSSSSESFIQNMKPTFDKELKSNFDILKTSLSVSSNSGTSTRKAGLIRGNNDSKSLDSVSSIFLGSINEEISDYRNTTSRLQECLELSALNIKESDKGLSDEVGYIVLKGPSPDGSVSSYWKAEVPIRGSLGVTKLEYLNVVNDQFSFDRCDQLDHVSTLHAAVEEYLKASQYDEAVRLLESFADNMDTETKRKFPSLSDDTHRNIGAIRLWQGQYEAALIAFKEIRNFDDDADKCINLMLQGMCYYGFEEIDKMNDIFLQSLAILRCTSDSTPLSPEIESLGEGDLSVFFKQEKLVGKILNNIGCGFSEIEENESAARSIHMALRVFIWGIHEPWSREIKKVGYSLTDSLKTLKEHPKWIYKVPEEYKLDMAITLCNLGYVLAKMDKWSLSFFCLKQSLRLQTSTSMNQEFTLKTMESLAYVREKADAVTNRSPSSSYLKNEESTVAKHNEIMYYIKKNNIALNIPPTNYDRSSILKSRRNRTSSKCSTDDEKSSSSLHTSMESEKYIYLGEVDQGTSLSETTISNDVCHDEKDEFAFLGEMDWSRSVPVKGIWDV